MSSTRIARRWLRNNPQLPGNPVGRGVELNHMLAAAAQEAGMAAEGHWRTLRSRGLTRNQIAHLRELLEAWPRLPSSEQARVREVLAQGELPDQALNDLRRAALLHSWSERVRTTNGTIAALEVRIEEQRSQLARMTELREQADLGDDEARELAELEAQQEQVADDISGLCRKSMELQHGVVREVLTALVDGADELVKDMVRHGVFFEDDVREYRGLADVFPSPSG